MKRVVGLAALAWATVLAAPAQPPPRRAATVSAVVIGAGYTTPGSVDAAPGQVITIFARVPGKAVADPITVAPPLPYTLGGFSALLRQTFPADPRPVPIQSAADSESCSQVAPVACDVVSMITVQIPYELTPNARSS